MTATTSEPMPATKEEAIARVQARHPKIKKGKWFAKLFPASADCAEYWYVSNRQGRKNGTREWTVDMDGIEEWL